MDFSRNEDERFSNGGPKSGTFRNFSASPPS